MEFHNLTPFPSLAYEGIDHDNNEFHVVAMRATFDIVPDSELKPAENQQPLSVADEYFGEMNKSSVKQESDLVQYKPKCDVIIIGSAHAPGNKPAPRFEAGIKITGAVSLDKKLIINGPRFWKKDDSSWTLTAPEPIASLPLQYEYAYGGECRINKEDPAATRVEEKHQLTPEQRQQHPDGEELAPIAHTAYEQNPVGKGYAEQWYIDATKPAEAALPVDAKGQPIEPPVGIIEEMSRFLGITHAPEKAPVAKASAPPQTEYKIPAPQIESPTDSILEFGKQYTPQGFGVITKSWLPRRKLCGTADEEFAKSDRWLPDDFDFAYWNGAHPDMQTDWPKGGERIELKNLLPPETAGATTDKDGNYIVSFVIPESKPFLFVRFTDDSIVPYDLKIDTVLIDTERNKATLVYRVAYWKEPIIKDFAVQIVSKQDQAVIDAWQKRSDAQAGKEVQHG